MKILCAIAPARFRDEELLVPQQTFSDADVETVVASTHTGTCEGMIGATAEATVSFADVSPADYNAIVVVGGIGAQDVLWNDAELKRLVQEFNGAGKVVAAICLSPVVLARAGILPGREATVFRSPASIREIEKGGARLSERPVVTDGNVVTADGPSAAEEFARAILSLLL
ncbi:DJ-1/PfpI family protein [Methanofollis fontis]|uniref:DJ-1/PfpI domain-containing protein n=1 Tax=Methanofollis fontis TaxID=2052832 RepID=A0A483CT60_9EURY|nr:DJ-1/PfpI family protein [Methanofollis fontis]TAJ44513.1 hypothetical protein CUJ86_04115 [Methanofollis fontis]